MMYSDFLREWLILKKYDLAISTYEAYQIYIEKHLIPYFGSTSIDELRPMTIQRYVTEKLDHGRCDGSGGLSRVSVRKHLQVIKESLADAVKYEYIPSSPANSITLPKSRRGSRIREVFLTPVQASELLSQLEGERLYPIVLVTLLYGLRRSEVLGLTWRAIDFDNDKLSVIGTVVKNVTIVSSDLTKTVESYRTFQLLPEVKRELFKLRSIQESKRFRSELTGNVYFDSDYVFTWDDGRPYRPDYLTRAFQKALSRHGFPKMRFHDLRHSTASILFDRGWSLRDVQEWLGHADLKTTSEIYIHYGRGRKTLVAKDLEGLLVSGPEKNEILCNKRKNAQ